MPGGLLQGRGSYDSLLPAEDNSHIFQSIKHHNTSFILEQREALEKQAVLKKDQNSNLEGEMGAWLANGALPFLQKSIKFLFLLTLFPFYFCFFLLPSLILEKMVKPVFKIVNDYVIQPVFNAYLSYIYRPIAFAYKKIRAAICKIIEIVKKPFLALYTGIKIVKDYLNRYVFAPPIRLYKNIRHFISKGIKAFAYRTKASYHCGRLLAHYGMEQVRSFKTRKD